MARDAVQCLHINLEMIFLFEKLFMCNAISHGVVYETSVVQYLCEQGAGKVAMDCHGMTPLHWAARDGHVPVVQYTCKISKNRERGHTRPRSYE